MTNTRGRGPGVNVPPPLFLVAGFVVGWLLERYVLDLLPPLSDGTQTVVTAAGVFLGAFGLTTALLGMMAFRRAQTAIFPNRDASRLVMSGPYRRTRNPMYTGLSLAYTGLSLMLSVGWALVTLPLALLALYRFVIVREERYLAQAFGNEYRQYKQKVRRWL